MEKLEFASEEWMQAMEAAIRRAFCAAPDRDGITFSYSEHYTGVPVHLARADVVGYTVRFADGVVDFDPKPSDDVDIVITADYEAVAPRVRMVVADDPERWASTRQPLVDAGQLVTSGSGEFPSFMLDVHDVIARRTA